MRNNLIWLINPYGNLPGEGWTEYRFSMIARCLSNAGFQVRWFVADFEHRSKKWRDANEIGYDVCPGYKISTIKSGRYSKHVSLSRIDFERSFAKNILESSLFINENPSLIIFGEPALFVADIYKRIASKKKVPYVVDILDLWPEIFATIIPERFVNLERYLLFPLYKIRTWFLKDAIGYTAVAPDYLNILNEENLKKTTKVIYIGKYDNPLPRKVESDLLKLPIKKDNEIWVVYAGTLGRNYDLESLMSLAVRCKKSGLNNVKIFVAGDGELKNDLNEFIRLRPELNIFYLGRLSICELEELYGKSDIAVSSYVRRSPVSMPLKAFDYFYFGLPLINSLGREVERLVREKEVGVQYEAGNSESMWNAFLKLYSNREFRFRLSNNSKKLGEFFTYKAQYFGYVSFVRNVLIKYN